VSIRIISFVFSLLLSLSVSADPFPPNWDNGAGAAIHYDPVSWPTEPANAADCGDSCGQWKPYTRFQNSINDPRAKDDSNGGTAPQNYVNIASSCVDKNLPSIYYYLRQGASAADDVIMFRWRVEQIANTYATGPNAGSFSASNPWSSALWTVLFDIDGSGYRSLAAHLNGSSGGPSAAIDTLAGIWSQNPNQSIDYVNDSSVHLLGHNPTAFVDGVNDGNTNRLLNFQNSGTPVSSWPNGSSETDWDYGTSRAKLVSTRSCNEYFVDYQIPVGMLDATGLGGPKITRSTPISMMFCTANSLNNPFQKDCAINKTWAADSNKPAPFGDYISFDKEDSYSQPIVAEVTAIAPATCAGEYELTTRIQDVLALNSGEVITSVKAVDFYYWYDADGNGFADDTNGEWVLASNATQATDSLNSWTASWDSSNLPKGRYLIGVQAVDDNTRIDDDMTASGIDNRTFSYLAGDAQSQVYIGDAWITGQQALFPDHSPALVPGATENWYGNPEVTGIQTALVGVAINTCGVAPTVSVSANNTEVAPGGNVTFTITMSNAGNPDAITVSNLTNLLPDGFSYQNSTTSGNFGTANPTITSQSLSWDFATPVTVLAGASSTLSFTATASTAAGNYNNAVTATTSFGSLSSDPVAVAVGSARLALSVTPDTNSTSPSGQVSYTLNYSNPSTVAIDSLTLTSTLPTNTTFQSCTDGCSNGANVSWSLGTLNPGVSGSVIYVLNVGAGYTDNSLSISSSLSGTDPASNPISTTASNSLYVNVPATAIAAFTLEKTASAVQVAPGANITYTLSYNNYGGATASNVVITDTLPAGMTYVSSTDSGAESSGTVTWNIGSVAASGTATVSVTVTTDNPFESTNPSSNTAQINWDGGTAVNASVGVGVTGQSCSTYYFRDTTTNVGFDGTDRVATRLPVPLAGDTGSTIAVTAPVSGAAFLEVVRFYQDPATSVDTVFSGTVDSSIFIDRGPGSGLDLQASLYDYNSISGATAQLGQSITNFGGNTTGELAFSVPVTGTLQKDHRLLWVVEVRSVHASKTIPVEIQYNGTVTNNITSGTTFANASGSFCVTPPANLSINKAVDLSTVPDSTTTAVVYTIDFANSGSTNATGASIVDTLPANVSFTSATLNGSSITPSGSNPYTFTVDTDGTSGVAVAGNSGVLLINASVSNTATGTLTNTASLSSDQTSAITDTADTLVGAPVSGGGSTAPELYISKTANVSLLGAGDTVTYTLTVVNAGNGSASTVVVVDDFPEQAYFSYQSCTTATGTCSESPSGTLNWAAGTLSAGGSATLTYQMQASTTGIPNGLTLLNNTASVSDTAYCTGGTPPASCSSETVTVSISGNPELALSLAASDLNAGTLVPGDLIEYTLSVNNNGSSTANELVISNPIPGSTGFVEITSGTGSFDTINNKLLFSIASMVAGGSATYQFTVRVNNPLASGSTTITDTATVTAANAIAANDSVNSSATAAAVISMSLSGAANVPLPATTLAANAANTTTLSTVSASLLSPGDYIRVNGTLTRILSIAANLLTVNVAVTATSGDDVQLAGTYSITYLNSGNAAATNAQVSETLPAGWLYVTSSPSATSNPTVGSNGTVSWTLGTVAAGDSGTLQFVALPTASGSVTHTATLTADAAISVPATKTVLVGGLTVQKSATTGNAQLGGTASYTITLSNSLAVPVNSVDVTDVLAAGFTYASSTTTPSDISDLTRPVWNVNVPANSSTTIDFTANVSADIGAASYQNEVEVVAPAGIGVAQFDALATKSEDVTLLVASGLMSGTVYYGSAPLAGIWVNFYDTNVLAYRAFTDAAGQYQQVLEAGNNWRVEISTDTDNDALLVGLNLATGTDPEDFTITLGQTLSRNFVYALTAPTVNSQTTNDTTPSISGTYPSTATGATLTVLVNSVTYTLGVDA
jgi:large repetitive protein